MAPLNIAWPAPEPEQSPVRRAPLIESLLASNSRVLRLTDGKLQGPGAELLLTEATRSQFVALGEEHNTAEIPEFTTALFRALQARSDPRYLAVEQDPVASRLVSQPPRRGNRNLVVTLARQYPHAFTFVSDQELTMLADVGATSTGRGNPVWGCDQAFGATHILNELLPLIDLGAARDLVTRLRNTAQEKERVRDLQTFHYMLASKDDDYGRLADSVRPLAGTAAFLLESLIVSDRIYQHYREGRYYANGYEREEYMKSRFIDEYRRAEVADRAAPKVVLKFGHWHLFRGLGPSNLQTLGNFVSEFARANASGSFHVAVFPLGEPGEYGDLEALADATPRLLAQGAGAAPAQWTIVDLRPLRASYSLLTGDMSPEQKDSFRRWIYGFDAALFMGRLHPASFGLNPGVKY